MAGGTLEYSSEGSFAKRFHAGNAARSGVLAAMMAKEGFTGPWRIFEGDKGFFTTHCKNVAELDAENKPVVKKIYDPSLLCDQLGKRYDLLTNSFKVHCGGRFGATSIDAALEIVKKHDVKADQVKEIHVGACDFTSVAHFFETCRRPKNIVKAQFSLPFAIALILLHRKVVFEHMKAGLYNDPQVREIMDKVTNYVDPEAEAAYPKNYRAVVTMILNDGTSLKASLDFPKGDPENRPTPEELHDKFRDLAEPVLSKQNAERLLKSLIELENVGEIRQLTAMAVK
jgi:2-methylcitrate dehydratase PrpD